MAKAKSRMREPTLQCRAITDRCNIVPVTDCNNGFERIYILKEGLKMDTYQMIMVVLGSGTGLALIKRIHGCFVK